MLSVVIGRFQTPWLHKGHKMLLDEAQINSKNVLVLIGCTAATGTDRNPLSYEIRKDVVANTLYDFTSKGTIKPLHDMPSDEDWSKQIDDIIEKLGYKEAVIFGGRENSIEGYYTGKHPIKIIGNAGDHSSTAIRKVIAADKGAKHHAVGIIHHIENRYPIVYSTVDMIIKKDEKYLVGKKGNKYCFIGGFIDPNDKNAKDAAYREAREETGIMNYGLGYYAGSMKIDDPRYRGTKDSIMTHCFVAHALEDINYDRIKDKEFKDFVWATKEELEELLHDFHKPLLTFIF